MARSSSPTSRSLSSSESGVLGNEVGHGSDDTVVGRASAASSTVIINSLDDAAFRFRSAIELIKVLERRRGESITLRGVKGIPFAEGLLEQVNGHVFSDGTVLQTRKDGYVSFVSPLTLGGSGNEQGDLTAAMLVLGRGLEGVETNGRPLHINIDSKIASQNLQVAFLQGLSSELRRRDGSLIQFHASDSVTLNRIITKLDGLLLRTGEVVRVSSTGALTIQKYYRVGQNGLSADAIKNDLNIIDRNARQAMREGVKFKVWLPAQHLSSESPISNYRSLFRDLRQEGVANNLEVWTEKKKADTLPGFVRMSSHAVVVEAVRDEAKRGMREHSAIAKIEQLLSKSNFAPPLVVWIKDETLGPELLRYLYDLRKTHGDKLKIVGSSRTLDIIADHFKSLEEEEAPKRSRFGFGSLVSGFISKFRGSRK